MQAAEKFMSTNGSVILRAFVIPVETPYCMAMAACHHYSQSSPIYGAFVSAEIASPIWGTTVPVNTVANCTPAKKSLKAHRQRSNRHRPRKPPTGNPPPQRDFGNPHGGLTDDLAIRPRPGWFTPAGAPQAADRAPVRQSTSRSYPQGNRFSGPPESLRPLWLFPPIAGWSSHSELTLP